MNTEGGIGDRICNPSSIEDYLINIGLSLVLSPLMGIIRAICAVRWYSCRDACPPGHTFYGAVCVGPSNIPDPPCEPGWTFNSGFISCTSNNFGSGLVLGEFPSICPEGYHQNVSGAAIVCIRDICDRDPSDVDESAFVCRKECKTGWEARLGSCWKSRFKDPFPSIPATRVPCDIGYEYDGMTTCWSGAAKPIGEVGITPSYCDPEVSTFDKMLTCWNHCSPGERTTPLVCESCPNYQAEDGNWYTMLNNGAGTCYKPCDPDYNYDGAFGCVSKYENIGGGILRDVCPIDYENTGLQCVPKPPDGYTTHKGDIINYHRVAPDSYMRSTKPATQKDWEVCGGVPNADGTPSREPGLNRWASGIGTCTGWLNC